MKLITIMPDLCDDKYRFHLAKQSEGDYPLATLTESKEAWRHWQTYRGNAKERFTVDNIVSFAHINGNRFLFGGIFRITSRSSEQYSVEYTDDYSEFIGRLVLDFTGSNKRSTVFKPSYVYEHSRVSGIYEHKFQGEPFISYEDINHNFNSIELIINNSLRDWETALSNVHGIYLISDKKTGKHYVGSACGYSGIWGRWQDYVKNCHGANDDLVELFSKKGETYFRENFKFCILEVLSPSSIKEEVIKKEALWKDKLLTKEHGHNRN